MALSTIPVELVLLLPPLLPKQDTSSLSRTCKRLRSIALAHVYKTIKWNWDVPDAQHLQVVSPPIHLLLRSLIENPAIGGYVEHVDFQGSKSDRRSKSTGTLWAPEESLKLTDSELPAAMQWVQYFGLASPETWSEALGRGDIDVHVSLALAFLPNLCSLLLSADFVSNSRFLGCLFKEPLRRDSGIPTVATFPRFTQLHEVHLGPVSASEVPMEVHSRFRDMYSVFYLPSLEVLTIEIGAPKNFYWPSLSQRARLASLTSLKLPHCGATDDALERILSTKPPLKELLYDYSCMEETGHHYGYFFDLGTLSRALNHVHTTLESLITRIAFEADADEFPVYSNGCFKGSLDSFYHFARLSHLQIPFVMLSDWHRALYQNTRGLPSRLPHSIRQLCLNDDMGGWEYYARAPRTWIDLVHDLLDEHEVSQGEIGLGLQRVALSLDRSAEHWGKEDEAQFENICKRYGVQTTLVEMLSR